MTPLARLTKAVEDLSAEVAQCEVSCTGVQHDRGTGLLPRCLFLELGDPRNGDELAGGTVVVGLNPGGMREGERRKINEMLRSSEKARNSFTADDWRAFSVAYYAWLQETVTRSEPFYTLLRSLLRSAGRMGPILWTEILKCETRKPLEENTRKRGLLRGNPESVATCTSRFLVRELEVAPKDWPVLAAGADAFTWASENAKGRTVVGVPHPSGATFDFVSLFVPSRFDTGRLVWEHGTWHSAKGV